MIPVAASEDKTMTSISKMLALETSGPSRTTGTPTEQKEAARWDELIKDFKYKPNFEIEHIHEVESNEHWLVLQMRVPDVFNPARLTSVVAKRLVDEFELIGEKAALHMIRLCIRDLEMHEIDEWINYRGKKIFDPHKEGI